MVTAETFKRGINKGFVTTWELTKVVVPIYIFVTLLSYIGVLNWVAVICEPVMNLLGLPGEASLVIVMGYALNIYAAIGVMGTLTLTVKEVTIIAVMLLLCHSLFIETAVARRAGMNGKVLVGIRLALSFASGVLLNILL
ncbi:nucleoside recognition domain-containing protein [Peptococcaceae bacterium 1198_IL3148]